MATKKVKIRLDFNILVYREDSWWIAHCLEMDLPAEGSSPEEALDNVTQLIDFQIENALEESDLASIFSPAPPDLWRAYAIASDYQQKAQRRYRKPINRLDVREMVCSC